MVCLHLVPWHALVKLELWHALVYRLSSSTRLRRLCTGTKLKHATALTKRQCVPELRNRTIKKLRLHFLALLCKVQSKVSSLVQNG